jgi:predicted permease
MLRSLWTMVAGAVRRARGEREMADELQFHLDARATDLMRGGLSHAEAQRRARLDFGAIEAYKDRCRDERGWHIGDELRADWRYAARMLAKNPGFSIVVIATLAIAIGANTAVFSVINGVLLRPLPYPDPTRLVTIYETPPQQLATGTGSVSYQNFLDWRRQAKSFSGIAVTWLYDGSLANDQGAERVRVNWATANLLSVLGASPALGRGFRPNEDQEHGAQAAIISFDLWQRRFNSNPAVLGQTIRLDGESYPIVGVLPAAFNFRGQTDVMLPLGQRKDQTMKGREFHGGLQVLARLAPGVSVAQAQAEMDTIAHGLAKIYPKTNEGWGIAVIPLLDDIVGDVRPTLFLLLGAVVLVLLIACSNVANLLLSRAETRRAEFALRTALGAATPRLMRQLAAETLLLALIGGGLGLMLASFGTHLLLHQLPVTIPRAADVGFDLRVAAFTCAVIVLTSFIFGLAPAAHAIRVDLQSTLKAVTRTIASTRSRARSLFVIVQLALALVLIVGTGLMLRTLWQLGAVDPGFDPRDVISLRISLSSGPVRDVSRVHATLRDFETRFTHMPGVQAASFTTMLPLSGNDNEIPYSVTSEPVDVTHSPFALWYVVTPGYFDTLRIPLRRGRVFGWEDATREMPAVVVDEEFARHAFAGQDPLGRIVNLMIIGKCEIVGVVGHVKHWGLDTDDAAKVREQIYIPYSTIPDAFMPVLTAGGQTLVLRSTSEPSQLLQTVRHEVRQLGTDQPVYGLRTMTEMMAERTARRRFLAIVLGLFASIALGLAAIGIYGVISYSVTQRVQEIGVRMALGASAQQVFRLVVGQGARLAMAGIIAGVIAAALSMRFLSSLLYGVTTTDPLTFATVAMLLAAIALAACAVPAYRAVRIEPTRALRQE